MRRLALVFALLGGIAVIYRLASQKPVDGTERPLQIEDLDGMTTEQLVQVILKNGPGKLSARAAELMLIRYVAGEIKLGDLDYRGRWQDDDIEWAK
jgi:hypothetical protein